MKFEQCLTSAVAQNAISRAEAEEILKRFEELRGQHGLNFDDATARLKARDDLATELKAEGIEARRRAALQGQIAKDLLRDVLAYRGPSGQADVLEGALRKLEHFGYAGYSSVEGRAKSIMGMVHAELGDVLMTFQRDIFAGKRKEMPRLDHVKREMFGERTGDNTAAEFAAKIRDVFESLRQRFNNAGGAIGKLDGWAMPQWHDAEAIVKAGKPAWKEAITPLLDLDKMKDPVSGLPMTGKKLDHVLGVVYDRIISDGWIDRKPSMAMDGAGMLASQRAEHRFLHFKDSPAWQKYADQFGQGDTFSVMFTHIRGMAADVAAMEVLGPNPQASINFMKQIVKAERGKAAAGEPSAFNEKSFTDLFSRGADATLKAFNRSDGEYAIDALWNIIRNPGTGHNGFASVMGSVRNVLTSAQLGSAIVPAVAVDPFIARYANKLAGLPHKNLVSDYLATFTGDAREAVHAGLLWDDALHIMGREARYAGALAGGNGTRYLADRTVHLSGLAAWTQARKHVFGMNFQTAVADFVSEGQTWESLNKNFRAAMEGFGIGPTEWAQLAKAELHSVPGGKHLLRPVEIAKLDERLAERYLEMILAFTERAVPSGTKRSRAMLTGGQQAGTVPGEILNGIMQYKSFGLSVIQNQIEAMAREAGMNGKAAGARYAGGLAFYTAIAGAVAMQLRNLANGKDPEPMDDARFWLSAAKTGGGFGIFGDFLFAEHGRFGNSIAADLMGPQVGLLTDIAKLGTKAAGAVQEGEPTSFTNDVIKMGRRYTPVVSSLVYTRAAWNRIALDQLQYLSDPDAYHSFRQQERRLVSEKDQKFFWRPGQIAPERVPDPANLGKLPFLAQ